MPFTCFIFRAIYIAQNNRFLTLRVMRKNHTLRCQNASKISDTGYLQNACACYFSLYHLAIRCIFKSTVFTKKIMQHSRIAFSCVFMALRQRACLKTRDTRTLSIR